MAVTVSGGIVIRADEVVLATSGPVAQPARLPRGTPVAVGPADAAEDARSCARDLLAELCAAAGPIAADAGVDLGGGFRSARIDGTATPEWRRERRPSDVGAPGDGASDPREGGASGFGDRRDAVLAVLRVPRFAERLGAPAALLVALFGPAATRPLGAATLAVLAGGGNDVAAAGGGIAAAGGRNDGTAAGGGNDGAGGSWAALRFAVAAAGLLGPEQVAELLRLRAPRGRRSVPRRARLADRGAPGHGARPLPGTAAVHPADRVVGAGVRHAGRGAPAGTAARVAGAAP